MTRTVYAIESHEQALQIWQREQLKGAKLLHIDFHCDQRGLLVNRKTQRAFEIWTRYPDVDEGNFLKHAVTQGIISSIRWVHDEPGGRKDDFKSVKFESDVSALPHRAAFAWRRDRGIPIDWKVMTTPDWKGIEAGEIFDIDWDYFAALEYPIESVQGRIDAFLARDFGCLPSQTIVCYSPEYSHDTREQFSSFVNELATRFDAKVVEIPRPDKIKPVSLAKKVLRPLHRPVRDLYHNTCLTLRRHGIF